MGMVPSSLPVLPPFFVLEAGPARVFEGGESLVDGVSQSLEVSS